MFESTDQKIFIPETSKRVIRHRARRIKPLVRLRQNGASFQKDPQGKKYYLVPSDIFNFSYTWKPEPTIEARGLIRLCDITTYHTYGYAGFFKPSVAEVLSQIPHEHLATAVAFEIIKSPQTVDDLNAHREALNAGYHVATTRLYAKKH